MSNLPPLLLTPDHITRSWRDVDAEPYLPEWTLLDAEDVAGLRHALSDGRPRPVPVFVYGSLLWNPGFEVGARRRARLDGWHRSFSMDITSFRGSPEQPGLMLVLEPGGVTEGMIFEPAGDDLAALDAMIRRELVARELTANAAWVTVETDRGTEQALTFFAGTHGLPMVYLSLDEQAARLAHAAGSAGTGVEYLQKTTAALAENGIYDPYMWDLSNRVAAILDASERKDTP